MGRGSRTSHDAAAAVAVSAHDITALLNARRNHPTARPAWLSGKLPDNVRWVGEAEQAAVRAAQGGRTLRPAPAVGERVQVHRAALVDAMRTDSAHPLHATTTTRQVQDFHWTDPGKFGTVEIVAVDVRELQRTQDKASLVVAPDGFVWVRNAGLALPAGVHRVLAHDLQLRSARTTGKRFGPMRRRDGAG